MKIEKAVLLLIHIPSLPQKKHVCIYAYIHIEVVYIRKYMKDVKKEHKRYKK